MPGKVIDVPYSINESDPNFTAHAASTASSGDGVTEAEFGTYLCPVGLTVVILPTSTLAAYLYDNEAAPAEMGDGVPFRIVHVDSAGAIVIDRIKTVYASIKDFADAAKMKKFEDKFFLREREKLILYAIPASGSSFNSAATSRFELRCRRISKLLSI